MKKQKDLKDLKITCEISKEEVIRSLEFQLYCYKTLFQFESYLEHLKSFIESNYNILITDENKK